MTRAIPNTNKIGSYIHCGLCLDELPSNESESASSYSQYSVGFTEQGLQVWCDRHNVNIMHIDFDGNSTDLCNKCYMEKNHD